MSDIHDIVLVGGGLASAKAAETLREEGFNGSITLITDEPERPYERPPLSKGVLTGQGSLDDVYVHGPTFHDESDVRLVTSDAAVELDLGAGRVRTASGRDFRFDRVLLATGARPRRLPLGEPDLEGIMTLRTLSDSRRLAEELIRVDHVTVVGAGWIGCEVAAAARTLGAEVTMVDPLQVPLERVLGRQVGAIFAKLHGRHGVDLRMGVGFSGASGQGRVERVTLSDGRTVDTDLVVVGIGVLPRTELAEQAGLAIDNGVLVDETLVSADARVFAAGDVANAWHPLFRRPIRVEHWANALNQGQTAGRNMLGAGESYDRLPYFYTDQYELGMEYVGHATDWDEVVLRGDPDALEFIAFWLLESGVGAAMNVNVWDVVEDLKGLIASSEAVDHVRLADPDVPLTDLVTPGR
ncbi:MAG: FAD-dependent oxidoreductase [Actinobacteria bacterium]|nr:FAD-dependent oxidoreductase [Actinomycetota bacterium]